MPPVSQRYRDARRRQIIDASRRCFAHSGFEGTSMQEICTQAGLSPGAVYGYFASKDDLVAAIVEEVLIDITAAIDMVEHNDPPVLQEALHRIFTVLDRPENGFELARLAVQVWAAAARNPTLNARLSAYYRDLHARFTVLVERCQYSGTIDPTLSPDDLAQILTALGPAFLSQRALLGDAITAETFSNGLCALLTLCRRT